MATTCGRVWAHKVRSPQVAGASVIYTCHTSCPWNRWNKRTEQGTTRSDLPVTQNTLSGDKYRVQHHHKTAGTSEDSHVHTHKKPSLLDSRYIPPSNRDFPSSPPTHLLQENTTLHTTNSHHPLGALPSKTPASNGVTPLRLLAAEHGLLAGHLLMPPRRLRPIPGLCGGFSEEEPDGGVWL